jgi:S1-C subfamily serine protease
MGLTPGVARLIAPLAVAVAVAVAVASGCGAGDEQQRPPTVLRVSVPSGGLVPEQATAFATGEGRAVTVAHVLAGARTVLVTPPGGGPARRARVLRTDTRDDLAVLAVPGLHAPALRRAAAGAGAHASVRVVRGRRAVALRATVRRPVTARMHPLDGTRAQVRPALELAAGVARGDSGAPVVDGDGRVVGVVFAQSADDAGTAYAVAVSALGAEASGGG